jgi:anti-sigma B factor antagonist
MFAWTMPHVLELAPLADGVGLKLIGEVDLATAPQLREALAAFGPSEVVLDLSELTFMDSSGLGVLLTFAGSRNGNGPVVLLDPLPSIERLFAIAELEQHPNVELQQSDRA